MLARRNRLVSLPSWLCLLGQLDTFRIDDNPFAADGIRPGVTAFGRARIGATICCQSAANGLSSIRNVSSCPSRHNQEGQHIVAPILARPNAVTPGLIPPRSSSYQHGTLRSRASLASLASTRSSVQSPEFARAAQNEDGPRR
jgi:hypothetical protein